MYYHDIASLWLARWIRQKIASRKLGVEKIDFSNFEFFAKIFIQRCSAHLIGSEKHQDCALERQKTLVFPIIVYIGV